jgi:tetratricopeptide (TPR) repeat protein
MFGWLRTRCPIDPGAKRWIEDRMGWLLGQFGRERLLKAEMIVSSRQFFPDRYDNSETAARALFDRTCAFMGVDRASVEPVFYQPEHRPGFARSLVRRSLGWGGQFQLGDERNLVRINTSFLPLPESLLAIFAHELSHQILLGSGRICAEDEDHEHVTDLATVFFGMGVFNANESFANQFRLNKRGDEILFMGYLTPRIWGYALALCAWLREEKQPAWANWLRPAIRKTFHRSLSYLFKTGDAEVVEGGQLDADSRGSLFKIEFRRFRVEDVNPDDPTEPVNDQESTNANPRSDSEDGNVDEIDGVGPDRRLVQAAQFIEVGKWDSATDCLSDVIRIEPDNGTAYQQRALVNLELGLFDAAISDAENAVRLEPDDPESYLARGAAYVRVGRFEPAVSDLTHYIDDEDFMSASGSLASRGYYLRGLAYSGLRESLRAIKDYNRAIRRWPDWPEPYEARAEVYELLGKLHLACADREEARRRAIS